MTDEECTAVEPAVPEVPLELRVHGVGGPQAPKMLGELHEEDVVTVPAFVPLGADGQVIVRPEASTPAEHRVPADPETRFAQSLRRPRTEAYEWGALTVASAAKALWILYLPFTLVNAGGWAHAAHPVGRSAEDRFTLRWHLRLARVTAYLATATYVGWISYLAMELVARRWVDHARSYGFAADIDECPTLTSDLILVWVPRVAPVVGLLVIGALFSRPLGRGRYEEVATGHEVGERDRPWSDVPSPTEARFFARQASHDSGVRRHLSVAVGLATAAIVQYMAGWHVLGPALLVLAGVQILVLGGLCVVDVVGRWRWRPREVFPDLLEDASVDDSGSRAPAGAAFAVVGTAMAHSAFAGLALLLAERLGRWPLASEKQLEVRLPSTHGKPEVPGLEVGPELLASDVLAWVLLLAVAAAVLVLLTSRKGPVQRTTAGTSIPGPVVRLARHVPRLLCGLLVAVVLPVVVFVGLNARGALNEDDPDCGGWERVTCWYDRYEADEDAILKRAGSFVLLLLPGVAFAALRGKHDTGAGRIIGNVWDVLTFWPRRFHPYAAPCSAERAVPELRARIVYVGNKLAEQPDRLVVVAHSQGSVLSAAAIASLPRRDVTATDGGSEKQDALVPSLVTFGSPLGSLYLPTWPSFIPPLLATTAQRVREANAEDRSWVNFWRTTDPIGAAVPGADNVGLCEPQDTDVPNPADLADLPPLERPARWGTTAGHGHYLAEPLVQGAIRVRRMGGAA